jgi:hypothetical protein
VSEDKKGFKPNSKMIIGGAVIGVIVGITLLGQNDKPVEQVDVNVKPVELGTDPINNISLKDRDAALTQFQKQFESVDQKIAIIQKESEDREKKMRSEFKDSENGLKSQVASLSQEIITLRTTGVEQTYQNVNKLDSKTVQTPPDVPGDLPDLSSEAGLNFDGLNFNMTTPKPQQAEQQTNPYGPNYFILKPRAAAPAITNKNGGNELTGSDAQLFASMSQPAPQSNNYQSGTPYNATQQQLAQPQAVEQPPAPQQQQYKSAAEAYEAQNRNSQGGNGQVQTGPKLERITIPAFSFVEVTTLHGVSCPIGANSPGSKSTADIPARPVVLPVRGIFRGPNGSSVDVGNIHLAGLCSGRRTSSSSTGRATIRVEQLSYWDATGDSQMSSSTGYIVDTRDNEQDVVGRLDKASGRTLALESMAAAAAAFATTMSASEFTTQNNLSSNGNGSTTTQQLTGDASKAAVSQGIAALFTKIGQRFEQEANAAIDTVVVEPGIRLRFVTDQPIYIYKPAEAFDIDAGMRDVLL